MNDTYCVCLFKSLTPDSINVLPAVLQFLFSILISICGVFLNYKFLKKLQLERRNKPPGRKGNVIEPIMRWFCVIQIAFWPYELLMLSQAMGIIQLTSIVPSLCPLFTWLIVLGRTVLAYNSLFVALTRYLYIVHDRKANQWDFEVVGRRFQIASISFPMIHVIIFSLTLRARGFFPSANHCLHMTPVLINFTMKFLSENIADIIAIICTFMMVFVYLNLAEGYLYLKIFQTIKR